MYYLEMQLYLAILYCRLDLGVLENVDLLNIEVVAVNAVSIPHAFMLLGLDFAFLGLQNFYQEEDYFELLYQLFGFTID